MNGYSMPPEWAPHECTLIAWPARRSLWGGQLAAAKAAYAGVVRTVARFEPVLVVANLGDGPEAAAACGTDHPHPVDVVEDRIDDSWLRDSGPIFVTGEDGERVGIDFGFNGWGEKFRPYGADDAIAARLCDRLDIPHQEAPLILEGGSITVDGAGTLVTTEQCLLHPSRNPGLERAEIEGALREWLGVERVVWLAAGLVEDEHTDGHVDNICAFVAPGVALVQGTADTTNPNADILVDNRTRLDAAGIDVPSVDVLPYDTVDGRGVVVPPLNCYFVNGGVIVPIADGDPAAADAAVARFAVLVPDREVMPVPASVLAFGGGGVHCITQQVPA